MQVLSRSIRGCYVDDASEHLCHVDGCVFLLQEAWVIAAVAKEELLFDASVGICEHTALGLEEQAEAFAQTEDIKSCKEVDGGQSNDALCHGERFAKGVALQRGILCVTFKEHDEERVEAQQGRGRGLPGGIGC